MTVERTRGKAGNYRLVLAIAAVVSAVATSLAVVPSWRLMVIDMFGLSAPKAPTKQTEPSPISEVQAETRPNPVLQPPTTMSKERREACGRWQSKESHKTYEFICQGSGDFRIRQIDSTGRENHGSGTTNSDGQVEAQIVIARNNRTAYLRLQFSSDGQQLNGSWYGNSAEESGEVSFHRVSSQE